MGAAHLAHLPRSASHETTGTFSTARIGRSRVTASAVIITIVIVRITPISPGTML